MRGGFSGWLREVEVARILFSGLGSIAWGAGGRRGGLALGPSQGLSEGRVPRYLQVLYGLSDSQSRLPNEGSSGSFVPCGLGSPAT